MKEARLHVTQTGSGAPVVLLHGTPSSPDDFDPLVAALAESHRVLVPHFPGYGRTPSDAEPSSLAALVARLEGDLIEAGVLQADFVAFCGGAYKAVAIALRGRVTVSRLVLLAPVVGLDEEVAQGYRNMASAGRTGAFDPRPSWLDRMASPAFAERNPRGAAGVLAWLDAAPIFVICDDLQALADAPDLRPRLREITCPALVFTGTADRAVPTPWVEAVAHALPQGRLERIEGAGHALLLESPEKLAELVRDFLAAPSAPIAPPRMA
jgi:pimeloyl-ACP methyl ester carboxylesterase